MADSARDTGWSVAGVSLIIGSLIIGFLLFQSFPMSQTYKNTVDDVTQTFTTECTISGDVLWDPSPALDPSHVEQAEAYCERWALPVVALSFILPLLGIIPGAMLLARSSDPEHASEPSDAEDALVDA